MDRKAIFRREKRITVNILRGDAKEKSYICRKIKRYEHKRITIATTLGHHLVFRPFIAGSKLDLPFTAVGNRADV